MALTQVDQGLLGTYAQYTGFKNRIINGGMVIDQRNAGASVTPASPFTQYTLDRFYALFTQGSKFSVQQSSTAPAGFKNSLLVTSLSSYSVISSDIFGIEQDIEGFNTADFGFGASGAATVTLSFWVRSSLTGTFGGSLQNSAINRCYPFSYTISAANTWEQKTITVSGDTTGTWIGATNGVGLRVLFALGAGSSVSGTAGAWVGADNRSVTGATSVVGTNGATFYITGVQLEKGSTATSFDYRPYGTELQLCQRYYEKSYNIDVAPGTVTTTGKYETSAASDGASNQIFVIQFQVSKRANPTMSAWSAGGTANIWDYGRSVGNSTATTNFAYNGHRSVCVYVNVGAAWTVSTMQGHWVASAEL